MAKRLGLIVRSDNTGLGIQTRAYYKHLKPERVMLVDISMINGNQQHYGWYENPYVIKGMPTDAECRTFLQGLDVVLTAETSYNANFYEIARQMGVKTVCVENPEFYDYIKYPHFPMPDVIILPSVWKQHEITMHAKSRGTKVVQIHHPVDLEEFPYTERQQATFMHIAGKPAANDRNGTHLFLRACPNGLVTTQSSDFLYQLSRTYRHSRIVTSIENPKQLYIMGNILVLPRKYGGNCLPLNEALASGMPVIMPDIEPNNHLLPPEWLVPAHVVSSFEPRTKVDIYETNHDALVSKLNWFLECHMPTESRKAYEIAKTISWEELKPKYEEVLYS